MNSDRPESLFPGRRKYSESMKLRLLLLLLSALTPPLLVHAQSSASKPSRTITGNVKNEKGEFIVGASVYVKSTPRIGTATDA